MPFLTPASSAVTHSKTGSSVSTPVSAYTLTSCHPRSKTPFMSSVKGGGPGPVMRPSTPTPSTSKNDSRSSFSYPLGTLLAPLRRGLFRRGRAADRLVDLGLVRAIVDQLGAAIVDELKRKIERDLGLVLVIVRTVIGARIADVGPKAHPARFILTAKAYGWHV